MPGVFALALFWFLYFCALGVFYPYLTLYLHENAGLDGTQVGIVLAVLPLVGIVAQPLWGNLADRTGARRGILIVVTACAAAGYAVLGQAHGFGALVAATALLAVFASAVVPLALSVTFAALRSAHGFGRIRVWGTIGYLVTVAVFPWFLHRVAPVGHGANEPGLAVMFPVTAVLAGAAALIGAWLPRGGAVALRAARGRWRALLAEPAVVRLLLVSLAGHLFLQGPQGMFAILIRAHGGDIGTIGRMWVMMLLLEIPLVSLSGAGLTRLGARALLTIGVLAGGVRWTACALTDHVGVIYAVQLLHGVVVAGLLLGGPLYLELVVPPNLRSTAQSLLGMLGVGVGGIVSNVAAGWLLEHAGPDAPFLAGGLGALVLGCAVAFILPAPAQAKPQMNTDDHR